MKRDPSIASGAQVAELLDMRTCIMLMRQALIALGTGQAQQMIRPVLQLNDRNVLGMMPAYDSESQVAGVKVLSVFPGNYGHHIPSHQGVIVLFETETGSIKAIVDAESITGIRTAAASAAATDVLARPDASHLTILGAGLQGRKHLQAVSEVRDLNSVTVWDLNPARAAEFAKSMSVETGLPVTACATAREAALHADIICTVTPATKPILQLSDVKPGAHINAVGACTADARELAADLMAAGRLYVDWKPAALKEAGDFLLAVTDGAITEDHILAEIGSVMAGAAAGRTDPREITIFEALGQATQDVMAANYVVDKLEAAQQEERSI